MEYRIKFPAVKEKSEESEQIESFLTTLLGTLEMDFEVLPLKERKNAD